MVNFYRWSYRGGSIGLVSGAVVAGHLLIRSIQFINIVDWDKALIA